MKKLLTILTLLLVMLLGACGAGGTSAQTKETGFTEDDLVFVCDGVSYPLKSDVSKLLEAFGSGYDMTAAPSCRYVGEDKTFAYDFAAIYTYPMDGVDLIDEINIFGGDFTTSRDIGIGDALEDIKAQYGEGFEVDMGAMYAYYLSGDPSDLKSPYLYFELEDGIVTGFGYYAASNVAE